MENSTIPITSLGLTPEAQSLDVLIPLIEDIHPDKDTGDIKTLCELINKEFDVVYTEQEIVEHYVIQLAEEDTRLIHKHYANA